MGFDAFIGNAKTVMTLRRKLLEGRFPHALIFSGPEGIGKHTCAVMVAKALAFDRVGLEADDLAPVAEILPRVCESPPATDVDHGERLVEERGERCRHQ